MAYVRHLSLRPAALAERLGDSGLRSDHARSATTASRAAEQRRVPARRGLPTQARHHRDPSFAWERGLTTISSLRILDRRPTAPHVQTVSDATHAMSCPAAARGRRNTGPRGRSRLWGVLNGWVSSPSLFRYPLMFAIPNPCTLCAPRFAACEMGARAHRLVGFSAGVHLAACRTRALRGPGRRGLFRRARLPNHVDGDETYRPARLILLGGRCGSRAASPTSAGCRLLPLVRAVLRWHTARRLRPHPSTPTACRALAAHALPIAPWFAHGPTPRLAQGTATPRPWPRSSFLDHRTQGEQVPRPRRSRPTSPLKTVVAHSSTALSTRTAHGRLDGTRWWRCSTSRVNSTTGIPAHHASPRVS